MSSARITGLYIYPVKSCRGIALQELEIGPRGPVHDREWMLVDEANKFLTLRTQSKLAEIKTSIEGSFLHLYAGSSKISVDFSHQSEKIEEVTVWDQSFKAGIENKWINEALSDFMSKKVKLARYQSQSFRDLGPGATDVVKETMFADSRPLLLVNKASLADLNEKLAAEGKAASVIERFRPNIIIEGLPAYSEDQVLQFSVKSEKATMIFANPKLCGRCPIITQDIATGKVVSKETLQILARDRKQPNSSKIPFGVYLTPKSMGSIKVGDAASV